MIRSQRLAARLGWHLEDKTEQRYQTGKAEGYISALSPGARGYELEEIFHEEDPLRVLRRLEHEGWAKVLYPALTAAKANENELNKLRDLAGQLEMMGIHPDPSPAYFPLLTAKLPSKDISAIKKLFARPGFAAQIAALESQTKAFSTQFMGKAAAAPSAAWKMLYSAVPEPILWLAHTGKGAPIQNKFKAFFNEWSQARNKIPYQLMQEMRITPDLPVYNELLEKLFFAIMDGKLETPEAARAFLEPYSPPAPPPPVNLRRRAVKREAKVPKSRAKKVVEAPATEDAVAPAAAAPAPAQKQAAKAAVPPAKVPVAKAAPAKPVAAKASAKPAKKAAAKPIAKKAAVKAPAKKVAAKKSAKPVKKAAAKPVKKAPAKKPAPVKKKSAPKPKPKSKSRR
jgi:tRNA nucleotidyltransferase (CCA-adding enzyme)